MYDDTTGVRTSGINDFCASAFAFANNSFDDCASFTGPS